jgi:hypothetical protein
MFWHLHRIALCKTQNTIQGELTVLQLSYTIKPFGPIGCSHRVYKPRPYMHLCYIIWGGCKHPTFRLLFIIIALSGTIRPGVSNIFLKYKLFHNLIWYDKLDSNGDVNNWRIWNRTRLWQLPRSCVPVKIDELRLWKILFLQFSRMQYSCLACNTRAWTSCSSPSNFCDIDIKSVASCDLRLVCDMLCRA